MWEDPHIPKSINVTMSPKWRMALQLSATDFLAPDYYSTIGPRKGKELQRIRIWYFTWLAWENVVKDGDWTPPLPLDLY